MESHIDFHEVVVQLAISNEGIVRRRGCLGVQPSGERLKVQLAVMKSIRAEDLLHGTPEKQHLTKQLEQSGKTEALDGLTTSTIAVVRHDEVSV